MEKIKVGTMIFVIISMLLNIAIINALVDCDPSTISTEYYQGARSSKIIECTNNYNSSVQITKSGDFQIDQSSLNSGETKQINITFNPDSDEGLYYGKIKFNDTDEVLIFYSVEKQTSTSQISFPTSKTINVQQGSDYDKKVTLIVPSSYPNSINIQNIEFSEENNIISFGDIETGVLNPGDVKDIPIKIHSTDAQVGEYPSISIIVRYDDDGLIKTVSSVINIIVTSNLNPTTNETFNTAPSCSISSSVMNVNETYQFTCSNVQKNLDINPQYNEYFEGINTILNGNIYTYYFKALKFGNTEFVATFGYLGAPLFSPFRQEIKISSSGSSVPGTDLKIIFSPSLYEAKDNEQVILNLVDNKTNSLVEGAEIFINSLPIISDDGYTFFHNFSLGKNYSIRGRAVGYNDLLINATLLSRPMTLTITPSSGNTNTQFTFSTGEINSSIYIDGEKKGDSPYTSTLSEGNHTIKAIAEGYFNEEKIIEVGIGKYASLGSEWKRGTEQLIFVDNSTWKLTYSKSIDGSEETLLEGNSSEIVFTPKKAGFYRIYSEGELVFEKELEGIDWKHIGGLHYIWWLIIIALIIIGVLVYKLKGGNSSSGSSPMPGLAGNINYGNS